jgi:hypothetical protein
VPLLFAAGVPFSKCGAAYLWDAAEVERLAATLHRPATPEAPDAAAGKEGGEA